MFSSLQAYMSGQKISAALDDMQRRLFGYTISPSKPHPETSRHDCFRRNGNKGANSDNQENQR